MPRRKTTAEHHGEATVLDHQFTQKTDATAGVDGEPYTCEVEITGVAPLLLHRYDCAEVELKGKASKNSATKKTDNIESYAYRCKDKTLGIPGVMMHAALTLAAKSKQDPRSPRKSARDLVNAVLLVTPEIASLGKKTWDYEDMRPVVVQRSRVPRTRPALHEGWQLTFLITVLDANYISVEFLQDLIHSAGKFCGLGDFRPQYGRFNVTGFTRLNA